MAKQTVADRIKILIDRHSEGKNAWFARDARISRAALYGYLDGKTTPGTETLDKIRLFTGCDLNWLVTGDGLPPGHKGAGLAEAIAKRTSLRAAESLMPFGRSEDTVEVPLVAPKLDAGTGAVVLSEEAIAHYAFRRDWLSRVGSAKDMVLFLVRGHSMTPTILDRDMVLVDLSQREMEEDQIFAVGWFGDLAVKRLRRAESGSIEVVSDNPAHPVRLVSSEADGFKILGKVLWLAREVG